MEKISNALNIISDTMKTKSQTGSVDSSGQCDQLAILLLKIRTCIKVKICPMAIKDLPNSTGDTNRANLHQFVLRKFFKMSICS